MDLRKFLTKLDESKPEAGYNVSLEAERTFEAICLQNKIMIAPGNAYNAEESGFFRITFTVEQHMLAEGLSRFLKSLGEVNRAL